MKYKLNKTTQYKMIEIIKFFSAVFIPQQPLSLNSIMVLPSITENINIRNLMQVKLNITYA